MDQGTNTRTHAHSFFPFVLGKMFITMKDFKFLMYNYVHKHTHTHTHTQSNNKVKQWGPTQNTLYQMCFVTIIIHYI